MRFHARVLTGMLIAPALAAMPAFTGVVNPDISALGQLHLDYTDDPASENPNRPDLSLGETEVVLDAALNPYARGFFVLAFDDGAVDVEEAYATLIKGLPWGLNLKAGKYRMGFGKLNPLHPHAYPMITAPRVMDPSVAKLLPGDESFNEVAAQVSVLLPTPGDWASVLAFDVIRGEGFHPEVPEDSLAGETRLGWLARWTNSFLLGERGALDLGLSATQGTNNVAADTKAMVFGADAKAKIYLSGTENLTLQVEALDKLYDAVDTSGAILKDQNRTGFYALADYRFATRYNAGFIYDQYQTPADENVTDKAIKVFAGFAVLEESTSLRVSYEHFMPGASASGGAGDPVNTYAAQLLFAMGPHKPHQF